MKTTLRGLALAAVLAAAGAGVLRHQLPPRLVFQSPGAQSTESTEAGFTVRGHVTRVGAPVAGARVRLVPLRQGRRDTLITSPVSIQAQTDETGRFEMTGVPHGPARLVVIADRFAPSITTLDVRSDPSGTDVALPLNAGVALEGRVVVGDSAVAGAHVSVRLLGHDSLIERRPLRECETDADGRYRLEGLDPDRPVRLVILAEGYRPYEKSFRNPIEGEGRIELDPGVRIWGRVVGVSGEPVAGAAVVASQGEGYTAESKSESSGEIRLGGLVARPLSIRFQLDGFAPARLELAEPSNGWTVTMRRNGGVAGKAPPRSWLVIETGGATYRRNLGEDGEFHWEGLPSGPAEARATDSSGRLLASRKVEIPEGDVADGILLAP
jgi:hypothetical protein